MKIRPNTWDSKIVESVLLLNEYSLPHDMRGQVVVDIGAHIGSFAVACAKRNAAEIFCFEPDPENFELLQANTADNTNVTLFNVAVVADKDTGYSYGVRRLTNHDFNFGRNTGHVDVFGTDDGTKAISINLILAQLEAIDLLKIDCEGAEWSIFANTDLSKVSRIAAELHAISADNEHPALELYKGKSLQELGANVSAKLKASGFDVYVVYSAETAQLTAGRRAVMSDDTKPKVLWIGDAAVYSGYARVTDNVCRGLLASGWDVTVLGIGYNGDPHKFPYKIYPAVDPNTGGARNGISRLKDVVTRVKPDIIMIQDDSWNVGIVTEYMAMNNIGVPAIGYAAVDSENVRKDVAIQLRNLKHVICHTDYGVEQLRKAGYNGVSSVTPHGIDSVRYSPCDRNEARDGISVGGRGLENAFIWGVVAANQPRKRLDLTVAYFAAWWKAAGRPDNAYLYVHTNTNGAYDLKQLADYCGVRGRLLGTDGGQQLPDSHMPTLYSAFDAMLHTSEGESFGLTMLEGMSCGIPQIAVNCGGAPSWAGEAVAWVQPSYYAFTPERIGTKRYIASESDFVSAMLDMYHSGTQREVYSERGRKLAQELSWDKVSSQFDTVLRGILDVRKLVESEDCFEEFA